MGEFKAAESSGKTDQSSGVGHSRAMLMQAWWMRRTSRDESSAGPGIHLLELPTIEPASLSALVDYVRLLMTDLFLLMIQQA